MNPTSVLLALGAALAAIPAPETGPAGWRTLAPGMALRVLVAGTASNAGDGTITVLRIDPRHWELDLVGQSRSGETAGLTAREWAESHGLGVATNAGMFATDHRTHVGFLRTGEHVNNAHVNAYRSVAAFHPRREGLPRFRIFDLDAPDVSMKAILADYASAVQNLRLIKRPGVNRWSQQPKRWSEAALGEDDAGRILLIFSRTPFTMHDLNRELLASDIGLVAAQHLEGGPEAQLYVRVGDTELELFGSYETDFREDDANAAAWPVPNVLGMRARSAP